MLRRGGRPQVLLRIERGRLSRTSAGGPRSMLQRRTRISADQRVWKREPRRRGVLSRRQPLRAPLVHLLGREHHAVEPKKDLTN